MQWSFFWDGAKSKDRTFLPALRTGVENSESRSCSVFFWPFSVNGAISFWKNVPSYVRKMKWKRKKSSFGSWNEAYIVVTPQRNIFKAFLLHWLHESSINGPKLIELIWKQKNLFINLCNGDTWSWLFEQSSKNIEESLKAKIFRIINCPRWRTQYFFSSFRKVKTRFSLQSFFENVWGQDWAGGSCVISSEARLTV